MFKYGDKVRLDSSFGAGSYIINDMGINDLYQVETSHMDFSFGSIPTEMYRIKNLRTGKIDKVTPRMIKYDIEFLRRKKLQKICSKLEIL